LLSVRALPEAWTICGLFASVTVASWFAVAGQTRITLFPAHSDARWRVERVLQSRDLLWLECSRFARRQIELKWTVTHTPNLFDVMSDLFKHFSDLPIASFVERDLQPGIVGFLDHANFCRSGAHALIRIALFGN
jgi:hypothetical protein